MERGADLPGITLLCGSQSQFSAGSSLTSEVLPGEAKSKAGDFDWEGVIDEACRRVIQAERESDDLLILDDAVEKKEQGGTKPASVGSSAPIVSRTCGI